MNENPEGTSNPRRQSPEVGAPDLPLEPNQMDELAPEPMPEVTVEVETVRVTAEPAEATAMPMEEGETTENPVAEGQIAEPTIAEVEEPVVEAMAEAEDTEISKVLTAPDKSKKKSKKTVWIVTAVVALLVAIGCAVAAIFLLNPAKKDDPVTAAIARLIGGETPKNIGMKGSVNLMSSAEDTTVESITINLESEAATAHNTSKVKATVDLTMVDGTELALETEGVMVASGDIYVKVGGIIDAMKSAVYEQPGCDSEADCQELYPDEDLESIFAELPFASIDGEWILISSEFLEGFSTSMLGGDSEIQCIEAAFSNFGGTEIKEAYEKNPFITSTTENVKLVSKGNTVYRLGIDRDNLSGFNEATKNSKFATELRKCSDGSESGSEADLASMITAAYVEIGADNNFSRIYLDGELGDEMSATIDLVLTYPSTIEITEPARYTNIETIFTDLFEMFGGFDDETLTF